MKASLRDTVGNKTDCPILVFTFYFKMFLSAREAVAADSSARVFEDNCVVVGNEGVMDKINGFFLAYS